MPPIDFRENPVAPEVKEKFESKAPSQYYDPCQDAADRSLKCLRRNMGDRDMCLDYFQAYRDCKKKWIDDRKKARFSGTSWAKTDSSGNNDEDSTAAKS